MKKVELRKMNLREGDKGLIVAIVYSLLAYYYYYYYYYCYYYYYYYYYYFYNTISTIHYHQHNMYVLYLFPLLIHVNGEPHVKATENGSTRHTAPLIMTEYV